MSEAIEFNGFKLRPVTEEADYQRLEEWIAADPAHASLFVPDFFLGKTIDQNGEVAADSRSTCYALEDESGEVFYIRLSRAARVHIQFPPNSEVAAKRTALALVHGMAFLEVALSRAGCEEWIFSTESPRLKKLAERALGFTESKTEMVRPIGQLETAGNPLLAVQQAAGGKS